ncbi:acyl-CoA thioesterase [Photobacterium sp. WH77]|uniref:Acyl-CoA thioesterase n=1 Tax=Photobacterium arenosum TaxID=2774143 RepID=A0ABR9BG77_9GAMM|nr:MULTISPECIES: acyl-CoA thioesterase [Photobacterium]MBD8511554.1 acyl-CoA thioesterase [Photobacterium arenosum]MBV7264180.1 acyl-CoA thioesterase [Photobacterium sp. WH24]MCG2837510.1 acyl-CoA thioesterase [Photobacterium sp. WH77]MCG2845126.1 acyl-CoA thioesterase [Photobacterium sp. WH80]MDO6583132.1 acyl-CoA thioesterase [Photobacterium sp. 2_MG-2023]
MDAILQQYPVVTEIPVAWGEMDALNHVNNVVYFRYFETARLDYFKEAALMDDIKDTGIGPVLSDTSARYRLPVTYPDTLLVGSRVSKIEDDRFTMEYEIFSKKMGAITTRGTAQVVMFDFKNNSKAKISPKLRDTIEAIEARKELPASA